MLNGKIPLRELSIAERQQVSLELDADIRAAAVTFGPDLRRLGVTTVALDDDGNLIRHHPDGTTSTITGATPP